MRYVYAIVLSCLLVACGGAGPADPDAAPPPCDPTGNWAMTLQWGSGNCGLVNPVNLTLAVTRNPAGGYFVSDGSATDQISGTITNQNGDCRMSMMIIGSSGGAPVDFSLNALEHRRAITGSGTVGYSSVGCLQAFTVTGSLN